MAILETKGLSRIKRNRYFEDYKSLKEYFKNSQIDEVLFDGFFVSAGAVAECQSDTTTAAAALGANDIVYVRSEADLAALRAKSIYITYVSSTGVVSVTESKSETANSSTEVPIGCEGGTKYDTVASVDGETITMTALNSSVANDLAGQYVIGCVGEQSGNYLTILSNTAASPTVITATSTPNANWAADTVSVQANLYNDVYRIRSMGSAVEAPTDNNVWCCDSDATNKYGIISDANTEAAPVRYFTPIATSGQNTRYFLGKVQAKATIINEGDTTATGFIVQVRFTPKATNSSIPAADKLMNLEFNEILDWQPCIELEPATDVIFYIGDNGTVGEVYLNYSMLEVNRYDE